MRRKIYDRLLQWKREKDGTTALMIEGARRVGKSYIAEEFARNEYDSYILIDFSKAPKRVKDWFDEYLEDVDTLLQKEVVTSRHNISPIEVKSGTGYTLTSIQKCIKKFGQYLSTPYVLHTKDVEQKDGLVYLPLYMTGLL